MSNKTSIEMKENISKENMNFPRYIFAIGGAGKNLIYATLEEEWILREILNPKHNATTVDITIIDTALDEENDDRDRIERIENKITNIEDEYRNDPSNSNKNIGRINIDYKLLTKEMSLQSPYALIGIEKKVKDATGAEVWWINDSEKLGEDWPKKIMTKENFQELNFSKGVYRKRAIGKAIYYKAISEGLFNIDIPRSAQIDILIGLGGGTGSGIAFDLAKRLKTIQPTANITLFGVLSTLRESPDEKANNFAMISEIEHGYLNRITPFKEVILIPIEVTEFPGREKASEVHARLLKEFDETIPYIIVAYHNNHAERLFAGLPEFAPFIIATSQLVRYNVESIKHLKNELIDSLKDKEVSLKEEEIIYNYIKKFIDQFYQEELQKGLPDEDKSFIKDRLSKLKGTLEHEFFKELNYRSVTLLQKAIEDGSRIILSSGDIERQVAGIKSETDMISAGNEGFKEDTDKRLYNILKKDIENIVLLKDILSLTNSNVQNDLVRNTLKAIITVDEDRSSNRLNQIREEVNKLTGKKRQLEGEVKSLEDEMKDYEEKIKKGVEDNNQEWNQNERKNIELLDTIDNMVPTLTNEFTNLNNDLEEYARRMASVNNIKNIDTIPTRNIEIITDKIYQILERIGIYFEDKTLIIRNLNNLKELRKAQLESGKGIPLLDKILKTSRVTKQKEAKNRVILKITELNSDKIFEIKNNQISRVYEFNIGNKIYEKKDEIINMIIGRAKDKFANAAPPLISGLKTFLETPEKRGNISINEIVKSNLGYDVDIKKIENDIKDKQVEMVQISKNIEILKTLDNMIIKNIKDSLSGHYRNLKNYQDKIANIGKDVLAMRRAKKDVVRYIMEMEPANVYKATATDANIRDILNDQDEDLTLRQNLRDAIERTVDNRYNVLVRRIIENKEHTKRWEKSKIMNAFVTIADLDPDVIDARDIIMHAFDTDRDNRSEWISPWGDSWGVGVVLFIAGVSCDNILNVADSRAGYYRNYKFAENNGAIFLHHSYLLEEGKFIQRKKIFNLEKDEDRDLFLEEDNKVKQMFSENYEEKELGIEI